MLVIYIYNTVIFNIFCRFVLNSYENFDTKYLELINIIE